MTFLFFPVFILCLKKNKNQHPLEKGNTDWGPDLVHWISPLAVLPLERDRQRGAFLPVWTRGIVALLG